jgi:hypothetical protein
MSAILAQPRRANQAAYSRRIFFATQAALASTYDTATLCVASATSIANPSYPFAATLLQICR